MVGIKPTHDPLQTTPFDAFTEDSAHDLGLCGIDLGHREPPARSIGLPNEIVAVTTAASDAARPYARAKRLSCARPDSLQLHLVAHASDEGRRGVNRIPERHLLSVRVVEKPHTSVADQLTDRQRDLKSIPAQPRLIATNDHVPEPGVIAQPPKLGSAEEIISGAVVV